MESKKIVVIMGSPRKNGNSSTLAQAFIEGAQKEGAKIETFHLHYMDIKPCTGCNQCIINLGSGCVIKDDMQQIYDAIPTADTIVIASPIYWFNLNAQTKLFLDRCYALLTVKGFSSTHTFGGKEIVIILTYGGADPFVSGAVNVLRSLQDSFKHVRAKIVGMLYGSASAAGKIVENKALMKQAFALGKKLSKREEEGKKI